MYTCTLQHTVFAFLIRGIYSLASDLLFWVLTKPVESYRFFPSTAHNWTDEQRKTLWYYFFSDPLKMT